MYSESLVKTVKDIVSSKKITESHPYFLVLYDKKQNIKLAQAISYLLALFGADVNFFFSDFTYGKKILDRCSPDGAIFCDDYNDDKQLIYKDFSLRNKTYKTFILSSSCVLDKVGRCEELNGINIYNHTQNLYNNTQN